ncbi:MAG: DUF1015 domain-containing protein [Proteobacteria bacterium]|nr:DUF1015 domain-containing protein [Pseudomonadota bacterium]MBT4106713.1 DUF1015 domain-containing protein [Pseudomonadota bacterium]MBT4356574.1 DUF1015 domain-containing protein [Pseudomonadota bacterium]MBT4986412.1 DUF1015 domain-containing protein [Pseudomonadota bacterium]MBT5188514.1 DUF1015 domain-containing protein [Pseudomonadota bacterium]
MTEIRAFKPYLVSAGAATTVVSPAYDSMSSSERLSYRQTHPQNYINVMRTTDDFPEGERPSESRITAENIEELQKLHDSGAFTLCKKEGVFVYQVEIDGHTQTGIVAEIPIKEYGTGVVRKHEETRKEHELRLVSYLNDVGASSSPVCLAYESRVEINSVVDKVFLDDPLLDFDLPDGLRQKLWQITDADTLAQLREGFSNVAATYLTDGHHRAASTLRYAADCHAKGKGDGPWDYLLVVMFPAEQLRVLPFNRCVRDLGSITEDQLLDQIKTHFLLEPVPAKESSLPQRRGEFLMLVDDHAYQLTRRTDSESSSPVKSLDVSFLQDYLLAPILGIQDARGDPRLDYVTGDSGLAGLIQRSQQGWRLGFACYPTSMEELMAVADAGEVMPPKSTCFDPKPRSGLFLKMS